MAKTFQPMMPRSRAGKFFTTRCAVWALHPDKTCRNGFTFRVSHAPDEEPISAVEHRNGSGTQRSPEMCAEWVGGARARHDENARQAPDRLGGNRRRVFEKGVRMQLVTQQERFVLGSCSCYFRSCFCLAQLARDESGRRSCQPDLTSFGRSVGPPRK